MGDGEKFGFWMDNHKRIYEEKYLENLLSLLEANADWLEFTTFSDYLDQYSPAGRIYLPSFAKNGSKNTGGGDFRNFLVKYPAANIMHKKMLQVSSRLRTLNAGKSLVGGHKKTEALTKIKQTLYKGQCGSAYWSGLGGGLYLNDLRHAVYSNLIQAEIEMEKFTRHGKPYVELTLTDFDKDGHDEVLLANNLLNLYFSPQQGGALFEFDYKPKFFNLVNGRISLLDHFLAPETDLEAFSSSNYREVGDFVNGQYSFIPRRKESEVGLALARQGKVEGLPVKVEKSVSLFSKQSIFNIEYSISNLGDKPDIFWFGSEFNFNLLAGNSPDRYFLIDDQPLGDKALGSRGENQAISLIKLVDERNGFDVSLEFNKPALFWRFPIETVFQSESGFEKAYQSSVAFPSWKFSLGPKETWTVKMSFRIEE
jgi:alpha-amylase